MHIYAYTQRSYLACARTCACTMACISIAVACTRVIIHEYICDHTYVSWHVLIRTHTRKLTQAVKPSGCWSMPSLNLLRPPEGSNWKFPARWPVTCQTSADRRSDFSHTRYLHDFHHARQASDDTLARMALQGSLASFAGPALLFAFRPNVFCLCIATWN